MIVYSQDKEIRLSTDRIKGFEIRPEGSKYAVDAIYLLGGSNTPAPYPVGTYTKAELAKAAVEAVKTAKINGQKSFVMP